MVCHSRAANYVLGLTEVQMNKTHQYGSITDNQLRVLEHLGVLRVNWLDEDSQGFSSSGYLIANANKGNFDGSNYDNPKALDGINFGIVSDGWVAGSGNGGLDGVALIEGIVKFVLDIPDGLEETDLNNVYFTYGTSPN